MKRTRFPKLAEKGSCVTIRIVLLSCSFNSASILKSCFADAESKAPVGSSANINLGLFTKALAQAHLCFCPPDTWAGNLPAISLMFSRCISRLTIFSISFPGIPFIDRGREMFSSIVNGSNKLKS